MWTRPRRWTFLRIRATAQHPQGLGSPPISLPRLSEKTLRHAWSSLFYVICMTSQLPRKAGYPQMLPYIGLTIGRTRRPRQILPLGLYGLARWPVGQTRFPPNYPLLNTHRSSNALTTHSYVEDHTITL